MNFRNPIACCQRFAVAGLLSLFAFLICLMPDAAKAQSKLEKGETVMVNTFHGWEKGTVIDIGKKKQYLVEYTFSSLSLQRKVFHRNALRRLCEYQAIGFCRNWKSANGQFEIEAALLRFKSADELVLRNKDMEEMDVKLSLLSKSDENYVKRTRRDFDKAVLAGQIPGVWPTLPPLESFSGFGIGLTSYSLDDANRLVPFGKLPSYLAEFEQHGVGFRLIRKQQELVSAIAVGGPDQLVLVNGREERGNFQSQLYWLSMKQEKVLSAVSLPTGDLALDYDARSRLLLTFNEESRGFEKGDPSHMTLWKLGFKETNPEPVVRWKLDGNVSFFGDVDFGKVISDKIVLTKGKKGQYLGWNVETKELAYMIRSENFFDAPARLTADRRQLIVPEEGRVNIYDTFNGELVMGVNVDARRISGANVNAEGTRLAAVSSNQLFVWDLESPGSEPEVYSAPQMASPFESAVDFVDDQHVIVDGVGNKVLFSLRLGVPLWTYATKDPFFNSEPLVNYVINGIVFYTEQEFFNSEMVAIGAVQLPGPAVEETTASLKREDLMILKPGVTVALEMKNVTSEGQVEKWLLDKIKENGWIYSPNAEIVLTAEMGLGPKTTVEYYESGLSGKTISTTFQPHFSKLKLTKDSLILWESATQTSPPSFIRTGLGGSIQNRINSYQQANIQFFKNAKIVSEVIDPKYSYGFGVSKLGRAGIEVVSTEPPGRKVNSLVALSRFNKDREAAKKDRLSTLDDSSKSPETEGGNTPAAGGAGRGGRFGGQ